MMTRETRKRASASPRRAALSLRSSNKATVADIVEVRKSIARCHELLEEKMDDVRIMGR